MLLKICAKLLVSGLRFESENSGLCAKVLSMKSPLLINLLLIKSHATRDFIFTIKGYCGTERASCK